MNKSLHRIIFNVRRGLRMVVAETACSQGKGGSGESGGGLAVSAVMCGLLCAASVQAQIVADPHAPVNQHPTVLQTANGLPQINIQTPSAAGVSRNTYSQFDVTSRGAVLNNSRTNTQTQLAGWVQGNPWLATGSARVILNEVNTSSPSQLKGYVEVAGQRAEVIIANPAGIQVNGGGFLNASSVTLTTGTPIMNTAALETYRVQRGSISIDGAGLDTSTADYTNILARSLQVNAGLWAKDLKAATGANLISASSAATPTVTGAANATGAAPAFALDVSQLGGMYAGKIFLVGTEAGVGVRNVGTIGASAGDVVVQNNGWLSNSGNIRSSGNTQITTTGDVSNSGILYASGNTSVTSQGGINNQASGLIAAQADTALQAATQINAATSSVIAAGLHTDGSSASTGDLIVNTSQAVTLNGQTRAGADASVSGAQLNLSGGTLSANNLNLTASTGDLNANAAILSAQTLLQASAAASLITDDAQILATQLQLAAHDLSNVGGQILQTGSTDMDIALAGNLNNTQGRIAANGQNLTLRAATLTNNNTQGTGQGIEGNNVAIAAATIINNGGAIRSDNNVTLTSAGSINNQSGLMSATHTLTVQDLGTSKTLALSNTAGTLMAGQNASVLAASLSGDGKVLSKGDLSIALTNDFNNTSSGEVSANGNASITSQGHVSNDGIVQANNTLTVAASTLTNTATVVGGSVTLQASQRLLNLGPQAFIGASDSHGLLQILAPEIINRDDITATDTTAKTSIIGLGTVALAGGVDGTGNYTRANSVRNESGYISSGGDMAIVANTLTNTRRVLQTSNTYTPTGQTVQGQVVWTPSTPDVPGGRYIEPPHGGYMNSDYLYTDYQGTPARNSITQISPKAIIETGGNLTPAVTSLQNYWSAITAAGNLPLNGVTVDQDGWQNGNSVNPGVALTPYGESITYSGTYMYRTYRSTYWTNSWGSTSPVVTPLGGYDSSLTAGGTISGSGNTVINTSGINPNTPLGTQSGLPQTIPIPGLPPGFSLPTGGLYHTNADPASHYLIETNLAFASRQQWLSSDYFFTQLGLDPTKAQKRLGDGYYEQQLVKEQLIGLTGRSVLDYPDAQSQYQALMQAGAAYAKQLKLAPGIALSAAQVAQLSQDVVILQAAQVNGQTVLLPVVYLGAHSAASLLPTGTLIAANNIDLTHSQGITNSGTIRAQHDLSLDAQTINNQGGTLQSGGLMQLASQNDINLTSATVKAGSLSLDAGKNIVLSTDATQVTSAVQGGSRISTQLGKMASIEVAGDALIKTGANLEQNAGAIRIGGNLQTNIGGNWTLGAVQTSETTRAQTDSGHSNTQVNLQHTSNLAVGAASQLQVGKDFQAEGAAITLGGPSLLKAGGNLTLASVKNSINVDSASASADHKESTQSHSEAVSGTNLQGASNLTLVSGQDITVLGSAINLTQGSANLIAAGSVNIASATQQQQSDKRHAGSHSGFLSSTSTIKRNSNNSVDNIASSLSATSVNVQAGQDITVKGSNVVSDTGTTLIAKNDLTIEAATNTQSQSSYYQTSESGLLSGGGFGITIGHRDQSLDQQNTATQAQASTVGSLKGKVTAVAGNSYTQTGSDVLTPAGDITVLAKDIKITETRETANSQTEQKFSQSGLSVSLSNPIISTLQSAQGVAQAASQTSNGRMQALGAASSLYSAKGAIDTLTQDPAAASSVGINISIGSSSSQNNSATQANTARGSNLTAAGNIDLIASGAGQDSHLLIQGSDVKAGQNATLNAEGQVNLLAAQNTTEQHSANQSNSASVGVGFSLGSKTGVSLTASAASGRGNADGADHIASNSHVTAGHTANLQSGGDTTLQGAVIAANTVNTDVGGKLNIESLSDTSQFDAKQSSPGAGVSLCLPPICYGASSINVNAGKAKVNGDFASVTEQSGIRAGDGGFNVNVKDNTTLKGAAITSTQAAIDANKNSFNGNTAEGLNRVITSDLQNTSTYQASGYSVGLTASGNLGDQSTAKTPEQKQAVKDGKNSKPSASPGFGSASGSAASTTTAGISALAGNKDLRTGDANTGLAKTWDGQALMADVNAQTQITAAFSQQASKAVGNYADTQAQDKTKTPEERACWAEGGTCRAGLHAAVGGLTGGIPGALGAGSSQLAIAKIGELVAGSDLPDALKQTLIAGSGTVIGAVVGGTAGAATAGSATVNNYLNHTQWNDLASKLKACNGKPSCEAEVNSTYAKLSQQQDSALATCDKQGNCAELIKEVRDGQATQLALVKSGALTDNYMGAADLQTLGLKLASNPTYRAQVAKAVEADNLCRANPRQCTQKSVQAALSVAALVGSPLVAAAITSNALRIAAAAGMAVTTCLENMVLCANKAGMVVADFLAADALGGASIAGGAAVVGVGKVVGGKVGAGTTGGITSEGVANAATAAGLKLDLQTTQAANEVVDSLRATGQLPSNYVTKAEAMQNGWQPGKALNNTNPGNQLGGDVFANSTNVLPSANGRVWYEVDVGLTNTMSRSNQPGTRLLYSNDGLLFITNDHYETVISIGKWR